MPSFNKKPTEYTLHPQTIKHLKGGHPWVTVDRFSKKFPDRPELLATTGERTEERWIMLNDPHHPQIKARYWSEYSNTKFRWPNFWNEFKRRLEEAVQFRIDLQLAEERENYYLLFGEGDHIPGLFIQKINNVILTQIYCNFWKANDRNCFQVVRNVIQHFFPMEALTHVIQFRNKQQKIKYLTINYKGEIVPLKGVLETNCQEHGVNYNVWFGKNYDFGLYTDMSSIRRIIERNISESDSCLNLYSYTGAFSLMALQKGAKEVHSVDLSESYLGILDKNIGLNEFAGEHVSHATSTERAIEAFKKENKKFDHIICDPPSYSSDGHKSSSALHNYPDLIEDIDSVLSENGKAYLFLNTHQVNWKQFESKIKEGLSRVKNLKQARRLQLGVDCRRLRGFPEGDYLKGVVLERTSSPGA